MRVPVFLTADIVIRIIILIPFYWPVNHHRIEGAPRPGDPHVMLWLLTFDSVVEEDEDSS